ncbi:MAG: extracellular solute-binding protein [Kiritimatiellia bacterium]
MFRNLIIILAAVVVVALPFALRKEELDTGWREGDPVLVAISPHNEAIRFEFALAFSRWHKEKFGKPVKVEWRNIGGTTEISRFLTSAFTSSFRSWWTGRGKPWPAKSDERLLDRRFDPAKPPADLAADPLQQKQWEEHAEIVKAFRSTDDPGKFTASIDVFFGGGQYDHDRAARQGMAVAPWGEAGLPADLAAASPESLGGEIWRGKTYFATALSTFGICYNTDRLAQLGVTDIPARWRDLTNPRYQGQVGVADPTKSGSIAKAYEMIIHQVVGEAVTAAGFDAAAVADFEDRIAGARLPNGQLPEGIPAEYQQAIERGWLDGLHLVQRIGCNARYFTDSSSKIPIDVGVGDAAVGLAIDFYARFQAEVSCAPGRPPRMGYVVPVGGTSVSGDPVSLLRGAQHRETAVRFIEFILSDAGQRLWNFKPRRAGGDPAAGGPEKYALRRLPVSRHFYPTGAADSPDVALRPHLTDELWRDDVNAYRVAGAFTYHPRWTGNHFSIQRDYIRAMCMDAGDELKAAWLAILAAGGPEKNPEAMALLSTFPPGFDWRSATGPDYAEARKQDYMRSWTLHFRDVYRRAAQAARSKGGQA